MIFSNIKSVDESIIETNDEKKFEKLYIAVREKENRIYTDAELAILPEVSFNHLHYNEWLIRKKSAKKLIEYLKEKKQTLKILEVGCGNGWFSNLLAKINAHVIGVDINSVELQQAGRVFNRPNLQFIYGDIRNEILDDNKFDIIVFAASVQYFSSLKDILNNALKRLNKNGEIHILDSNLYTDVNLNDAKQRTINYYASLGFPEMANYYFHHSRSEFTDYQHKILYNPSSFKSKFLKNKNPFPWICIKN